MIHEVRGKTVSSTDLILKQQLEQIRKKKQEQEMVYNRWCFFNLKII